MPIELTGEQRSAVFSRAGKTLVSAAAGSGKTRVIVERILDQISGPEARNITEFLVITFTNAAAAELRERLQREITVRAALAPSDRHLRRQLSLVPAAQITTIDAFCYSLIREFAHLCDLSPSASIADGAEAELLREEAMENTLESLYEEMDQVPAFAELAGMMSAARDDRTLAAAISETYSRMQSHPYPDEWMRQTLASFRACADDAPTCDFASTVWGSFLLESARRSVNNALASLRRALTLLDEEPVLGVKYAPAFRSDIEAAEHFLRASETGWDNAAEAVSRTPERLGTAPRDYPDPAFRDRIKSMREVWKRIRGNAEETISEPGAVHLEEIRRLSPAVEGLFYAVKKYEEEYCRLKTARGWVDFNDVSHAAIRLLCRRNDGASEATELAGMISDRYAEVLIDEFQDTNGIQTLLADTLTRGSHRLYMVGDVKQSIYRFRLAEPEIFLNRYQTYKDYDDTAGSTDDVRIVLSKNFRSGPEVIGAVNSIFTRLMTGGFAQIRYGEKEMLYNGRIRAEAPPFPESLLPEFHVLDIPKSVGEEEESIGKTEAEAEYTAGLIRSMLDDGFEIEEDGRRRPVRAGDIAILLRSASRKAAAFERALARKGVGAWSEKGGSVRTAELAVITSLLSVLDNAYQDVPLVGVMTSPIYGFTSDELAAIRAADRRACMYDAVRIAAAEGNARCAAFLDSLRDFRLVAADSGIDRLIRHIYAATGLPALYSAMEGGAGRRKNLMRLYEYAVRYEASGRRGIYGFLRSMEKAFANGTFASEESARENAVRIMTIHKSKGMEFPVVFLCDLSCKFNMDDTRKSVLVHPQLGVGMKLLDQEQMYQYPTAVYTAISKKIREESLAEEMRILYVAMTRAKDKLMMICALPDAAGKLASMLKEGGYPGEEQLRTADSPSKWLLPILATHPDGKALREAAGLSEFGDGEQGTWKIVMAAYGSNTKAESALTQDSADSENPATEESGESCTIGIPINDERAELAQVIEERLAYRYPYIALSKIPSKLTATQLKGKAFESELLEDAEGHIPVREDREAMPAADLRRPRFATGMTGLTPTEKGTAVHLAMQFIDLSVCSDGDGVRRELARLREKHILTEEQADAVPVEKILRFVDSDIGKRAFRSGKMNREFKFSLLDDCNRYYPDMPAGEKILVQGVCDLYFEEEGGIVVIDFKSDRVGKSGLAARAETYRPQIDLYAYALERITGQRVKEKYLYFFATDSAVAL